MYQKGNYSHALNSKNALIHREHETVPCDTITAVAQSDELGHLLWRGTVLSEPQALRVLIHRMVNHYHKSTRKSREYLRRIITTAVHEHIGTCCESCLGTGQQLELHKPLTCTVCNGTGKRIFTDEDRATLIHVPFSAFNLHRPFYQRLLWHIASLEIKTEKRVQQLLS
jgi:hypothetical protein